MRLGFLLTVLIVLTLAFISCESMEDALKDAGSGAMKDVVDSSVSSSSTSTPGSGGGAVDFKSGEVLVAFEGNPPDDAHYLIAKNLTPPSADTKDEGEFLFVERGSTIWSKWYFDTYIPDKDELELGMEVFFCGSGRAHFSPLTTSSYREATWYVGRLTDLDELFKDIVYINGDPYQLASVRLPVEPWD